MPASYPPVEIALAEGIVHMNPGDPRLDPDLEEKIGAQGFAAIELGGRWTTESSAPKTPTVRAFWMIAAP